MTLPPGQHPIDGFPRFGTHLHRPPPAVPIDPVIEISGAVVKSFALPLAELATLPRRELTADFHCVAGWSATNLHGVAFAQAPSAGEGLGGKASSLSAWSVRHIYRLIIPAHCVRQRSRQPAQA